MNSNVGGDHREVELSVIGMCMIDPGAAQKVSVLPDDTFMFEDTVKIHQAIKQTVAKRQNPDLIVLSELLPQEYTEVLLQAGNVGFSSVMIDQYIGILMDHRRRRTIRHACETALLRVDDMSISPDDVATECTNAMQETYSDTDDSNMTDAVTGLIDSIDEAKKRRIYTGIGGLDQITGGLRDGKLVIIGARPGVGKTALVLSVANYVARNHGRVLMSSLEMSSEEIASRLVAAESSVDLECIESGNLTEQDHMNLARSYAVVTKLPIIVNTKLRTPLRLWQKASSMAHESQGLSLIVVDYIQLMEADSRTGSRYEAVSQISRQLKLLAMELKVPIIALTQLNRSSEMGTGADGKSKRNRPTMAEAKDSGSIEQDANIFIIQYAPDRVEKECPLQQAYDRCQKTGTELQMLFVDKNRQGRTGFIVVEFDKPHMTFKTLINDTGRKWF